MSGHYEVGDGVDVVMRLPAVSYGALYQTNLLDHVLDHVKERDVRSAWVVVDDAMLLAALVDCPWCDEPGLHDSCWSLPTGRGE
jgi:hypothetical protein